jgi:uncharacterized membrane protein YedE/YeeE
MKNLSFFAVGLLFGVIMTKSEAISWFRIHEMFRFESFHMYGIIGVAVVIGVIGINLMKRMNVTTWEGTSVDLKSLPLNYQRHLIAGSIFGLGWALVGACPGPMFILFAQGYWIIGLTILGALLGTYTYGVVRNKLPH